ncbi:MAG: hypothetical protein KCHDKBKB_00484 [Elusimicrobia bacterium]|nr:hypothetical protein [Elusimicrobiota bacterium]
MKRLALVVQVLCVSLMLGSMTSCQNGNLFGGLHKSGESGDTQSLVSDASIALRNQDYSAALDLYNRVLAQDPNNSEALYGAAAAALGGSGLNFGALISNVLNQNASVSVSDMGDFISHSRGRLGASATLDSNSILKGIDFTRLRQELPTIKSRLEQIILGLTDLKILPDDVDVHLNIAAVALIDATVVAIDAQILDITNVNGEFDIVKGANFNTACSDVATIKRIGSDIAIAYYSLTRVILKLNLSSDKIISKFRTDIAAVGDSLLDPLSADALPAGCLTTLDSVGINKDTYKTYTGTFL